MVIFLCFQTVKEQFPDKEYDLKYSIVTFSDGNDPFISIDFEREVDGWIFRLQGGDKVQKSVILSLHSLVELKLYECIMNPQFGDS